MELEFSLQICEKYLNIKFNGVRPVEAELLHATEDRHGEANCRFSQLCERT
jgi:hypothetical protein